jgi:hypothetical protein
VEDGYEKVSKILSEGICGEEIEFLQSVDADKILINLKTGRIITIDIYSDDESAVFNAY